jgi:hypothetical protein
VPLNIGVKTSSIIEKRLLYKPEHIIVFSIYLFWFELNINLSPDVIKAEFYALHETIDKYNEEKQ